MPTVKMKSGKMKSYPYTAKGKAAAKKAAGKANTRKLKKRSY